MEENIIAFLRSTDAQNVELGIQVALGQWDNLTDRCRFTVLPYYLLSKGLFDIEFRQLNFKSVKKEISFSPIRNCKITNAFSRILRKQGEKVSDWDFEAKSINEGRHEDDKVYFIVTDDSEVSSVLWELFSKQVIPNLERLNTFIKKHRKSLIMSKFRDDWQTENDKKLLDSCRFFQNVHNVFDLYFTAQKYLELNT